MWEDGIKGGGLETTNTIVDKAMVSRQKFKSKWRYQIHRMKQYSSCDQRYQDRLYLKPKASLKMALGEILLPKINMTKNVLGGNF